MSPTMKTMRLLLWITRTIIMAIKNINGRRIKEGSLRSCGGGRVKGSVSRHQWRSIEGPCSLLRFSAMAEFSILLLLPDHKIPMSKRRKGLRWYAQRLKIDEDGDVADEFFDEVLPDISSLSFSADNHQRPPPRKLKVKCSTQPAIVRKQMVAVDGRIHHSVEYRGRLQWV
ncbi:hypothetical protein Syun_018332 [Stephania yunnanensis]|uniref:Uncharacterized protein n=1 Tax=Stephania yunnanensis TaxID=152371 RepID=A0AAP0NWY0_9MAGN